MSDRRNRPATAHRAIELGARVWLLALIVLLAGCDGSIGVIGQVLSPAGEPVAGASVTLSRPGTAIAFEASSDAAGCFQIGGMVSPGKHDYALMVASPEYPSVEGTFQSSGEYAVLVQLAPEGQEAKSTLKRLPDSTTSTELERCLGAWAAPQQSAVAPAPEARAAERWQCRNDLEVRCGDGRCEAETGGGFTPMSVAFDDAGTLSVCAYSGCWEGAGEVFESEAFLVLVGHDLPFSTAPEPAADGADVVLVLDRTDAVAMVKVGGFAHPLLCERLDG